MTPFMPTVTLSPDALVRIEGGEVITWAECERRLLAARTPVVPVGREVVEAAQRIRNFALAYEQVYEDGDLIKDADAILAALGTKGAEHD